MRPLQAVRFFLLAAVLAACGADAPTSDQFEPVREKIRAGLEAQKVASIAVAVAKDGEILWEEGFGWADREKRIPATAHTAYSLASISKPITATGLMTLVEKGQVELNRPVNDYLGDVKLQGLAGDAAGATVAAVASHTAGLPLHYQFYLEGEGYPRPSMDETFKKYAILVTPPGEKYQYSNLGFGILDYVIERKSGKSYPEFMREQVFEPLGLEHTSIPVSSAELDAGREWAVRYHDSGDALPFYDFDHRGGSAVYACAHDLMRFGMFHLGQNTEGRPAILNEQSIREMQKPIARVSPTSSYGLGWRIEDRMGVRVTTHAGGMGGVATSLVMAPAEGLTVVVLSNGSATLPHEISHEIFATLLPVYAENLEKSRAEKPAEAETKAEIPAELRGVWTGYVQTYQARLPLRLTIGETTEQVQGALGGQAAVTLERVAMQDGYFTGVMAGDIGTPDANRREYTLNLSLKRRGDVLNGAMSAVGKPSPKLPNALTTWVELRPAAK